MEGSNEPQRTSDSRTIDASVPKEEVVRVTISRAGIVLSSDRMLKGDLFPSGRDKKLPVQLEGAPNFRKAKMSNRIFGCGQPSESGILEVCKYLSDSSGDAPIQWINMRQEPIIYINDLPYCVKERTKPFSNIEAPGSSADSIADLELRLKEEILSEAARYGGRILLHGERDCAGELASWGEVFAFWEPIDGERAVLTVAEVFAEAAARLTASGGPSLLLTRVPVMDEHEPQPGDLDTLATLTAESVGPMVFNCQLGRGRATTGMVAASMVFAAAEASKETATAMPPPPPLSPTSGMPPRAGSWRLRSALSAEGGGGAALELPDERSESPPSPSSVATAGSGNARGIDEVAGIERGDDETDAAVTELVCSLAVGERARCLVDECCSSCDQLQHLKATVAERFRRAIAHARRSLELQNILPKLSLPPRDLLGVFGGRADEDDVITALNKSAAKAASEAGIAAQYLDRYATLLRFADYLLAPPAGVSGSWALCPFAVSSGGESFSSGMQGGVAARNSYAAWLAENSNTLRKPLRLPDPKLF